MLKIPQITAELQQHFIQGRYAHLTKFYSVRELAAQYQISLNSANRVLQSLEDMGFLTSKAKSGFMINQHQGARFKPTRTETPILCANPLIKNRANQIRLWAEQVSTHARIRFDLATSSPEFYPTHALQILHNRLARHHPSMLTEYAIGSGWPHLRAQVAQHYHAAGCHLSADDVLITHGATHALMLALQATTQAGDWVLIEAPTYFGFLQLLDTLQLNAIEMPINVHSGLQPANVQAAIDVAKTKGYRIKACLLQANFHNPTGACIAQNVRLEILELCASHDIAVIEDDTFAVLSHQTQQRIEPLKSLDQNDNVILCSSLSKLIAPGLRIGFVAGARWTERIKTLQHASTIACATLPQAVLAEFMQTRYGAYIKKLRQTCATNIAIAQKIVADYFPDQTQMTHPKGGYLLWLTLPETIPTQALFECAMTQQHIAFAQGALFSHLPNHQTSLRLNCALLSKPIEQAGLQQLGELAQNLNQ